LALGIGAMVWAAPGSAQPRPCPNVCVPNVRNFGYFPTTWRQWPGEQRLERINPRAFGAEVLPTPEGQKGVPPPQAAPPKPPAAAPQGEIPLPPGGTTVPPERLPTPQGEIPLPPGGMTVPPERPEAPAGPAEAKPVKPPIEGGLPGLPPETDQPPLSPPPRSEQPRAAIRTPQQIQPSETPPREYRAGMVREPPELPVSRVVRTAYVTPEPAAQPEVADGAAAGLLALGGYCAVELVGHGRWVPGDRRWTVIHKGRIYRLSGPAQRQQFLANPDAFAPVNSGNDPVLAADESRLAPGQPAYCATYNGRLYLFSSAATQARFNQNPQRYAAEK